MHRHHHQDREHDESNRSDLKQEAEQRRLVDRRRDTLGDRRIDFSDLFLDGLQQKGERWRWEQSVSFADGFPIQS